MTLVERRLLTRDPTATQDRGGDSEQAPELPGGMVTVVSTRWGPGLAQHRVVCFRGIFMVDLHDEMGTTVVPISQMAKRA